MIAMVLEWLWHRTLWLSIGYELCQTLEKIRLANSRLLFCTTQVFCCVSYPSMPDVGQTRTCHEAAMCCDNFLLESHLSSHVTCRNYDNYRLSTISFHVHCHQRCTTIHRWHVQCLVLQIQVTHAATHAEQTQKAADMVQQSVTWQPSCILRFQHCRTCKCEK